MELRFFGATRGVTGSCHMVQVDGRKVLLDCGLFQGRRLDTYQRNAHFHFRPEDITAVVQSHSHIDHSGKLPMLWRHGFRGLIHATRGTSELCEIMLLDCAHILMKDAEFLNKKQRRREARAQRAERRKDRRQNHRLERVAARGGDAEEEDLPERADARRNGEIVPLYLEEHVLATLQRFVPHDYGEWFEAAPGMRFRFHDAGHILGSSWVEGDLEEKGRRVRLVFTGDYGRPGMPILRDPEPLAGADYYISESTYGNRHHPDFAGMEGELAAAVNRLVQRGRGRVLIPAFAVGRTQNVLYSLRRLFDAGMAPRVEVVVDSPLAAAATRIIQRHSELFDREARAALAVQDGEPAQFCPGVRFTESVEESKALNHHPGPLIVVSASGMMESGRILHHLANHIGSPDTEILVVGFMAQGTLGRRLVEGADRVNILGDSHLVRARVTSMLGFSAHADRDDLLAALSPHVGRAQALFLVHGEDEQRQPLAEELRRRGFQRIEEPVEKQAFRL